MINLVQTVQELYVQQRAWLAYIITTYVLYYLTISAIKLFL